MAGARNKNTLISVSVGRKLINKLRKSATKDPHKKSKSELKSDVYHMVADLCLSCFRPATPPSEKWKINKLKQMKRHRALRVC
jgi:hypothetical protein